MWSGNPSCQVRDNLSSLPSSPRGTSDTVYMILLFSLTHEILERSSVRLDKPLPLIGSVVGDPSLFGLESSRSVLLSKRPPHFRLHKSLLGGLSLVWVSVLCLVRQDSTLQRTPLTHRYSTAIVPLYNGETSPKALRGMLLVLYQLQIIIG